MLAQIEAPGKRAVALSGDVDNDAASDDFHRSGRQSLGGSSDYPHYRRQSKQTTTGPPEYSPWRAEKPVKDKGNRKQDDGKRNGEAPIGRTSLTIQFLSFIGSYLLDLYHGRGIRCMCSISNKNR